MLLKLKEFFATLKRQITKEAHSQPSAVLNAFIANHRNFPLMITDGGCSEVEVVYQIFAYNHLVFLVVPEGKKHIWATHLIKVPYL